MASHEVNTSSENAKPPPVARKRKPYPRPKPQLTSRELPKPQYLSTTSTPLTNDPLWKDALVNEGECGLSSIESTKQFNADAAGFVALVEAEYDAIADCDKFVTKTVPRSAYAYYNHVLWWYRQALFAQRHGTATNPQERLIQYVDGYTVVTGAGAATALSGIGDYTDATGVKHEIVATNPNENGHFGRLNEETHGLYETLIAPAVSFSRVTSDIEATRDREVREMVIPQGIMPLPEARPPPPPAPAQAPAQPVAPPAPARPRGRGRGRRGRGRGRADLGLEVAAVANPDLQAVGTLQDEDPEDSSSSDDEEEEERAFHRPTANLGWARPIALNKNQMAEMTNAIEDDDVIEFTNNTYRVIIIDFCTMSNI